MKEGEETMAESVRNKVEGNVQNSVLAGDGATVTQINTPKHITKVKAQIIPGENGISSEQALVLQNKVKEVAEWESRVKQSPKTVTRDMVGIEPLLWCCHLSGNKTRRFRQSV